MQTIRVGVVGAGILGTHHAQTCAANELAKVTGIADLRFEQAQKLADKVQATPYTTAEQMFAGEKIDLAVIATPDPFHKEPFLLAVDAGVKAILCEKPLATTTSDAEEMMLAADRAKVRVFVNYANRFAWLYMATHHIVQQGYIGKPVYGEARLDDNISVPYRLWGDRSKDWTSVSSTAHFLLTHVVDLLHWFFAPARVEAVYAIKHQEILGFTPDLYDGYLFWNNGMKSRVKAEWIKHIENLVEFYVCLGGATGSIVAHRRPGYGGREGWRAMLDSQLSTDAVQSAARWLSENDLPIKSQMIPDPTCGGEQQRGYLELEKPGERVDDDLFLQAVAEDTDTPSNWQGFGPLPSGEDGLKTVRVISALTASADTGQMVKLAGI